MLFHIAAAAAAFAGDEQTHAASPPATGATATSKYRCRDRRRPWRRHAACALKSDHNLGLHFEAERAGGRIYSARGLGPKGDLTPSSRVPLVRNWTKAYGHMACGRCSPPRSSRRAQLPIAQYEPGDPTSFMYKIVDAAGHNAGYDTFVTKMLGEATAAGARVEYKRQLVSISGTTAAPVLHLPGDDVKPSRVLLNLPQLPLLRLLSRRPRSHAAARSRRR